MTVSLPLSSRLHVVFGLELLAAALMLSACGPESRGTAATAEAPPAIVRQGARISVPASSPLAGQLQIARVTSQAVERPIDAPAVIEADPARILHVVPPAPGRIVRLHKQLGDTVRRGDALYTLDAAALSQAWSDAAKAQAALALAQRTLQRQQTLTDADIGARKDLEQAQSDEAQARSESQRTQSALAQLGASAQARQGREVTITSPLAGHVIDLAVAQGAYWNDATAAVMTVADLSTVWVVANVQEKDLSALHVGQHATLALTAYAGETATGTVRTIGEVLDADTRTVKVRIAVDNSAGRLRPGMYAHVTFDGPAHPALVVPATALVQSGFHTRVYVEQGAGEYVARDVTTGATLGDRVEITTGLKSGERIVVRDGMLLND